MIQKAPAACIPSHLSQLAGAEEVAYIYVDLQNLEDIQMPASGSTITLQVCQAVSKGVYKAQLADTQLAYLHCLQSLNSVHPQLVLSDGTILQGKYQDTIGSLVLFDQPEAVQSNSDQELAKATLHRKAEFLCHTEKQLTMQTSPVS